jgi:hypothetical protein
VRQLQLRIQRMHGGRTRLTVPCPLDGDLPKDRLGMAGIQAPVGMQRPFAGALGGPHLDCWADIAGPPLGHVGFPQQALNLAAAAVLLPLYVMQGQLAALLTHQPRLQGLKLPVGTGQVPDSGQPWDGWQWDSGGSMHDRLLLARVHPMNDASSQLAIEAPVSIALFHP